MANKHHLLGLRLLDFRVTCKINVGLSNRRYQAKVTTLQEKATQTLRGLGEPDDDDDLSRLIGGRPLPREIYKMQNQQLQE